MCQHVLVSSAFVNFLLCKLELREELKTLKTFLSIIKGQTERIVQHWYLHALSYDFLSENINALPPLGLHTS